MSPDQLIDDGFGESFDEDETLNTETKETSNAKTRKRIDELLEKKRLKELLDEDEWEL
ncbi:PA3496 family putative envelope integrity protein [Thalassotalea crassostreae]|uniref:PA3496 family putative envelope integrity protein n=1 Tax=Thalassotalea crassostreae TaxID=1763536 RepID=UPI0012FDCB44|nr:hypothetical protein [Thalassotalea crassostreae]